MNERLSTSRSQGTDTLMLQPARGLLQRACMCGQHTNGSGQCSGCQKEEHSLRRSTRNSGNLSEVPSIVHEVLRSPGQPLDAGTRTFMESRLSFDFSRIPIQTGLQRSIPSNLRIGEANDRFEQEADRIAARVVSGSGSEERESGTHPGFDFSHIRVHTDEKAAASARAVGALAYTVGTHVVLGSSQYAPHTSTGRHLLAHELVHTLQQTSGESGPAVQRMLPCPATLAASDPVPPGFKAYFGPSCVFHCCYRGILEDRRPTASDPQNECFYDDNGTLVTAGHPHAGCRGTPNSYDSSSSSWDHFFNDPGGIWESGWDAFWSSRRHGAEQEGQRIIDCHRACATQPWYLRGFCLQGCSGEPPM